MGHKEDSKRRIVNMANGLGELIEGHSDKLLYNEMLELAVTALMKPLLIKDDDKGVVLRIAVDRSFREE